MITNFSANDQSTNLVRFSESAVRDKWPLDCPRSTVSEKMRLAEERTSNPFIRHFDNQTESFLLGGPLKIELHTYFVYEKYYVMQMFEEHTTEFTFQWYQWYEKKMAVAAIFNFYHNSLFISHNFDISIIWRKQGNKDISHFYSNHYPVRIIWWWPIYR